MIEQSIAANAKAIDMVWLLMASFLVFLMQAGFACVETGFTRAKNTVNIIMKNLMDFSLGVLSYFVIGYGLMFGKDLFGLIGSDHFFLTGLDPASTEGSWTLGFWLFQSMFAAAAATIVSGAVAERTKFSGYLFFSVFITGLIYPIAGHWAWGGGWLSPLGFIDFAGSTVVHSVGGWAALIGAWFLGPRIGKYGPDGSVHAIKGHNLPLAGIGVFLLWFGWFGFNAGSTLSGTSLSIAAICVTTVLAAAGGVVMSTIVTWKRYGTPDVSMAMNGALAGLVSITAGCANVSPMSAIIIGVLAGVLVVFSVEFIDRVLLIDDPVGAVSVHGTCGAFGTLMVGLFAQNSFGGVDGLFFGGGIELLKVQFLGVVVYFIWTTIAASFVFGMAKQVTGLRVSPEEELKGLDLSEHGMDGYAGFQIFRVQ